MLKRIFLLGSTLLLTLTMLLPFSAVQAQSPRAPRVSTTATFQVIIAAPLGFNVDVYLDGVITRESGANATKPDNASGFIVVETTANPHSITLFQTGTTTPQIGTTFSFSPAAQSDTSIILLPDMTWTTIADIGTPPAQGMALARVINLSPNNATIDATVDAAVPSTFLATAYMAASSYIALTTGSHTLTVPNTALTTTHNFLGGHVYSILIFGDSTNGATKILTSTEFDFSKRIYLPIIHN